MAFNITYKPLFEVQFRHGFYLNKADRKQDYALENYPKYDVTSWLRIHATPATQHWLNGHKARAIVINTGIIILIKSQLVNGLWQPVIPVETVDRLQFMLEPSQSTWEVMTNLLLRTSLPSEFYFTNNSPANTTPYPYLSRPVPVYSDKKAYEMGAIVANDTKVFFAQQRVDTAAAPSNGGNEQWLEWLDKGGEQATNIVTDADRLLIPSVFEYTFKPVQGISLKKGSATLTPIGQNTDTKTIDFDESEDLKTLKLDFSDLPEGFYNLSVTSEGEYEEERLVYLRHEKLNANAFGMLDISLGDSGADFHVLEDDANLRHDDDGNLVTPVFQLLFPNRYTFWQYRLKQIDPPALADTADVSLQQSGAETHWITKRPYPLCVATTAVIIQKDDPQTDTINEAVQLPNPTSDIFVEDEDGRYCSTIYLTDLKL